jgi:hypothetical protein
MPEDGMKLILRNLEKYPIRTRWNNGDEAKPQLGTEIRAKRWASNNEGHFMHCEEYTRALRFQAMLQIPDSEPKCSFYLELKPDDERIPDLRAAMQANLTRFAVKTLNVRSVRADLAPEWHAIVTEKDSNSPLYRQQSQEAFNALREKYNLQDFGDVFTHEQRQVCELPQYRQAA